MKKNEKLIWSENHQTHFEKIKTTIANATENTHFNPTLETRVKCDASCQGLGAALEQLDCEGWKTVAFASRLINSNEKRYSIKELELLGVVWAIEYFKYYLFGKNFTVLTDHRSLLSVLRSHRSNKSHKSRLARWIDSLLTFDFNIEHIICTRMGLVDYISCQPNQKAKSITQYDEEFMVAKISRIRDAITILFSNSNKIPSQKQQKTCKNKLQVNKTQVHSCKFTKSNAHSPNASNNSLTSKAKVKNYNSEFISSFNCHANNLFKIYTAFAPQTQTLNSKLNSVTNPDNKVNHITMSANESSQIKPSASPQTPRVTFELNRRRIQMRARVLTITRPHHRQEIETSNSAGKRFLKTT